MYKWVNSTLQVRENNVAMLRAVLRGSDAVTTAEMSARTGLSFATCGKIIAGMVESGEVVARDLAASAGGRPARLYAYNANHALTARIFPKSEDGRPRIVYEIRDAKNAVLVAEKINIPKADAGAIRDLLDDLVAQYPAIKGAALSIPGIFRNGVVGLCDLPELTGVNIDKAVGGKYPFPVKADHDMNLAALGYYHQSGKTGSVAYIVVPAKHATGAGLVVDGKLISGHNCFAGEVSFIPLGVSRERQFAGLDAEEALAYTAKLATILIAVVNPSTLVVASELANRDAMKQIRAVCLESIPKEFLPEFVARKSMDKDCLAGLGLLAEADVMRFSATGGES